MTEKVSRRKYIKYAGAAIIVGAVAAVGYGVYEYTKPKKIKEIKALDWANPITSKLQKLANEDFTPKTGIKVTIDAVPWGSYMEKCLMSMKAEVSPYDVVDNNSEWTMPAWVYGDHLFPLNDLVKASNFDLSDFMPIGLAMGYYPKGEKVKPTGLCWDWLDGKWDNATLYGVPYWNDSTPLLYRKDWLGELGAEPPGTMEELLSTAQKLTKEGQWGYCFQGTPVAGQLSDAWNPFLNAWNVNLFDKDWNPVFNTSDGVEATQFFVDLYQKYKVVPPGVPTYDHQQMVDTFKTGVIGMICPWGNGVGTMTGTKVEDKVGYTLPPRYKSSAIRLAGCQLTIPKTAVDPETSWEYIKWASSPDVKIKLLPECSAVLQSTLAHVEKGSLVDAISRCNAQKDARLNPSIPNLAEVSDAYSRPLSEALTGKISIRDALSQGEKNVRDVMKAAGFYG